MAQNDKLLTKQDVIGREMFINDEWVRLREGPSLNDKIITSLGYGKAGVILEVSTESIVAGESNRWYRIQLPYGEIGWVWGKYVSLVAEVAEIEKIRRVSDTVLTQNDLDVHGLSNIQSISDIIPYYQEYYKTYNNLHYGIDLVIDSGNEDILLGFSGKVYSNGYDEAEGYTVHMGYGYEFEDSFIALGNAATSIDRNSETTVTIDGDVHTGNTLVSDYFKMRLIDSSNYNLSEYGVNQVGILTDAVTLSGNVLNKAGYDGVTPGRYLYHPFGSGAGSEGCFGPMSDYGVSGYNNPNVSGTGAWHFQQQLDLFKEWGIYNGYEFNIQLTGKVRP